MQNKTFDVCLLVTNYNAEMVATTTPPHEIKKLSRMTSTHQPSIAVQHVLNSD